jgi:hypothetical protein
MSVKKTLTNSMRKLKSYVTCTKKQEEKEKPARILSVQMKKQGYKL